MSANGSHRFVRRGLVVAVVGALLCGLGAPALAYGTRSVHSVVVPSKSNGVVFRSASTRCPSNQTVKFGGFTNGVAGMRRTASNKWTVDGYNLGGPSLRLTAIAYCGRGPAPVEATKSVRITSFGIVTATCPRGKVVVGGGFAASPHSVVALTRLERVASNKLLVSAYLRYGITKATTLTAIAYCGKGPAPTPVARTLTLTDNGGKARARCPAGKRLMFGGVIAKASGSKPPLVFSMLAEDQGTWRVRESTAGQLTSLAYCR